MSDTEWGGPAHVLDPEDAHGAAVGMVWLCRYPPRYGLDDHVRYMVSFRPLRRENYGTSLSSRAPVLYLPRMAVSSMESLVGGAFNFPTPAFAINEGIATLAAHGQGRRSKRWFRRLWRAREAA